jgi:hypothetical protein
LEWGNVGGVERLGVREFGLAMAMWGEGRELFSLSLVALRWVEPA